MPSCLRPRSFQPGNVKIADLAEELAKARRDLANSREETKEIFKRQNDKLRMETAKLKKENERLRQQDKELRKKDDKIQREMSKLHSKLRQADSKIKMIHRKDNNITMELQKMIKAGIKAYLDDERICVGGRFDVTVYGKDVHTTVEFGYTFARAPTVTASLSRVWDNVKQGFKAVTSVDSVSNSSAIIYSYSRRTTELSVAWLACL